MRLNRFFRSSVLSVKAASERFRIPKGTIYDLINKGKIKVLRHPLGRRILIPEEEYPKLQAISVFYLAKEEGEEVRP
jgi:excisionase family DNA binding protein